MLKLTCKNGGLTIYPGDKRFFFRKYGTLNKKSNGIIVLLQEDQIVPMRRLYSFPGAFHGTVAERR